VDKLHVKTIRTLRKEIVTRVSIAKSVANSLNWEIFKFLQTNNSGLVLVSLMKYRTRTIRNSLVSMIIKICGLMLISKIFIKRDHIKSGL